MRAYSGARIHRRKVTPDLQSQLQEVLGPAYRVDRELGGAGMSRVFVASDVWTMELKKKQ